MSPDGSVPSTSRNDAWQLAEQALVDCCYYTVNNGCGGGGAYEPMQCAVDMTSLSSSIAYPYRASDTNKTCSNDKSLGSANVCVFTFLPLLCPHHFY